MITKNNRIIKKLYTDKVLNEVKFVKSPRGSEYGYALVTSYNKDTNFVAGDFAKIMLYCRVTKDDTSTSVFPTSQLADDLSAKQLDMLKEAYLELQTQKDSLYSDWKKKTGAYYEPSKEVRNRTFKEKGYVITSNSEE